MDSHQHEIWADKLTSGTRVLATVNETDDVLDFSDILNPDRLGNTLNNLNSDLIQYFNFGKIPDLAINEMYNMHSIKPTCGCIN